MSERRRPDWWALEPAVTERRDIVDELVTDGGYEDRPLPPLKTDGGCVEADAEIVMMYDSGKSWKEIRDRFDISVEEAIERYRAEKYDHWDTGWELGPADAQSRFETGDIDVWGDGEATVEIEEIFDAVPLTIIAEDSETRTLAQANLTADQARTLAETLHECADIMEEDK